ncbi:DNRLRE domain-containing protein [Dactylosporangium sp. AC04546]|uniref:CBM96 family carbohydrate-binding protein n=1 Tax=Dactylosporangium sp. AC04546 TaxID=2862460 RepID=UPI001EDF67F2|nr:DNRLRE domain-containing protein [Dactylosporangium sp. AC04546]WVK83552.1 DNRLRE domain-containing protein [Dactylosporangium sp. AC04546]
MRLRQFRLPIVVGTATTLAVATATVLLTAATPAAAATTTFTPVADTYVQSDAASTNYGTATQIVVDNSPVRRMFLRFTVSGVSGTVTGAKLRLRTISGNAGSPAGGTFRAVSNTTWSETGTTWNNQPALDGASLGSIGSVSSDSWYEVDVFSVVKGNGTFSFGASSSNSDGAYYDTRETGADAPQLVLTTGTTTPTTPPPTTSPPPSGDPVLVGAGDIATSGSGDSATAALINGISGTVFTTGDNVYNNGTTSEFNSYYTPTWGAFKSRTRPSPGNHDYNTSGATGYYTYFGTQAGPSGRGYYSYDIGNWHVVSLNSNVSMSAGSAQEQWLRADLAASTKPCTLAYWHHPLFTSGANHAPSTSTRPLYQALYDYNADVVVWGHNHQYERFAPMNPTGGLDNSRGLRSFVAGMGGADHYSFGTIQANSQARNSDTFGVLKFTLHTNSYDWQFVPESGKTYNDSGTGSCH